MRQVCGTSKQSQENLIQLRTIYFDISNPGITSRDSHDSRCEDGLQGKVVKTLDASDKNIEKRLISTNIYFRQISPEIQFCVCVCVSFDKFYFHFDDSHRNDRINIKVSFVVLIFSADRPENRTKYINMIVMNE